MTDADSRKDDVPEKWVNFDSESYFNHYYGEPHPDDDLVLATMCGAFKMADNPLNTIDVGTGPNLYPFFAALPRAERLTAWEYSPANVAWLKAELRRDPMRPQWDHFWKVVRDAYGPEWDVPSDPVAELRRKATVLQGSIYDLPKRGWDAATMFFCAEAVTDKQDEFDKACACFAGAVRPGGMLAAAFILGSAGYEVGGRRYSVMKLSEDSLKRTFGAIADAVTTQNIGIVEEEVRSGYTGMCFLTARAR